MPKHNDLEYRALQLISSKGTDGILQSDLWRELNASSREGSRISLKLENKFLIRREKELHNGRWTYRVYIKRRPIEIDSIANIPCVSCVDIDKCESGSEISPSGCKQLDNWLGIIG